MTKPRAGTPIRAEEEKDRGLTRRTHDRPDRWHGDGRRWDGDQRVRVPAPMALLGGPRVHGKRHWN